jgi:hypothetical protein
MQAAVRLNFRNLLSSSITLAGCVLHIGLTVSQRAALAIMLRAQ